MELTKRLRVPVGFVLNDCCRFVGIVPTKADMELTSIPAPRNNNKNGHYIRFAICCDCSTTAPLQENRIAYTVFTMMWRTESPSPYACGVQSHRHATS